MLSCLLQFCIYGQVTAIFSNFLFVFLISVSLTSEPDSLDDVDAATSYRKRKINQFKTRATNVLKITFRHWKRIQGI